MRHADLSILQVSPSDAGGGAEKVAVKLHEAYRERGYDAWLALGADHGLTLDSLQIPNAAHRPAWARAVLTAAGLADPAATSPLPRALQRAARLLAEPARYRRVLSGLEDFDSPGTNHLLELTPSPPDVLHLHNLHGSYFDIRALPELTRRVPAILTMHDAWLLTGHCAQPIGCDRWRNGCGECPALERYVPIRHDRSAENRRVKRDAVRAANLRVATPSRWLAEMVACSDIADSVADVRVVPNGIDTRVFAPGDGAAARAALGLAAGAFVLAAPASRPRTNAFKGFDVLELALPAIAAGLPGREVVVLALGADEAAEATTAGVRVRSLPFTSDDDVLAARYRAADVYVHPARAESFGLAVLEAMACGTPVVASCVGGIPEVLADGAGGVLVPPDDSAALAAAVVALGADAARRHATGAAGTQAASAFTLTRQVDAYLGWYAELAGER